MRDVGPYLGLGMQLAIAVLAFFFLGWWVDTALDSRPIGMLVGVALGLAGGMLQFIRTVTSEEFKRDMTRDDEHH